MQLAFGDAEDLGQRKRTRREIFLAEMEQVVPWKSLLALLALIEPHYPKIGRTGPQPYPPATMLRIHFLQQWYALSDPAMEEALYEIPTLRRFAQLSGLDAIPDETPILNFVDCWRRATWRERSSSGSTPIWRARTRACARARSSTRRSSLRPARPRTRTVSATRRCTAQALTLFALSNLWMARRRLLAPTG